MKKTRYPIALTEIELQKFRELSKEFYGSVNLTGYMSMILRRSLDDLKAKEPKVNIQPPIKERQPIPNFIKGGVTPGGLNIPPKYARPVKKDRIQRPANVKKAPLTVKELQEMADKIQQGKE